MNKFSYKIQAGDTLSAIALRELRNANRWQEITNENGQFFTEDSARKLKIGQIVYLPEKATNSLTVQGRAHQISDRGLDLIIESEGIYLNLYNCPANHATIGVGHLVHHGPINGSEPEEFKCGITRQRAMEILRADVSGAEAVVNKLVKVPLNQNQFDALVSFVFNLGETNFAKSTLLARVNALDYDAVPSELNRWVYAKGKILPGLVKRRQREGQLFQGNTF
ncbi:putative lysozyme [Calothrix sp. NIES-4071]|nr:putative lysozyme [Calothrix sp. NIES-4071]BAZ63100.1 putative lysozyme [Calothrix sp. NIES-4105]